MDWTAQEDFGQKYCLISSQESFFTQFMDSKFKRAWTGFWQPPVKCLNHFSYDYNQRPLTNAKLSSAHLRGSKIILEYDLGQVKVIEENIVYRQNLISIVEVKNNSQQEKEVNINLNLGFNAETRQGDRLEFSTEFDELRQAVKVEADDRSALYGLVRGKGQVDWQQNQLYQSEATSNGEQASSNFSPGSYQVSCQVGADKLKRLPFIFSFTSPDQDVRIPFDVALNSWFEQKFVQSGHLHTNRMETDSESINNNYNWCNINLKDLYFLRGQDNWKQGQKLVQRNKGQGNGVLFSGLPHSQFLSGRDLLWSLLGLLDMGEFKVVEEQLRLLAGMRHQSATNEARLPSQVSLKGETTYQAADVDPLFLLLLSYYHQYTGQQLLPQARKKSLDAIKVESGLVQHEEQETWMTSVDRGCSAIEIQSMLLQAKQVASSPDLKGINYYWDGDAFVDSFRSSQPVTDRRANLIVPLFFGLIRDRVKAIQALKEFNSNLICQQGVNSLSSQSDKYNPRSKYNGAVWTWLTLLAAAANLRYGRTNKGLSLINKVASQFERDQIGALPSYVAADSGEPLSDHNHSTASSLFFHTTDSYLLGVRPKLDRSMVTLAPKLPQSWDKMVRKDKRLGDNFMEARLRRKSTGDDIKLSLEFKKRPDFKLKVVAPGRRRTIERDGNRTEGSLTFRPNKEDSLEFTV